MGENKNAAAPGRFPGEGRLRVSPRRGDPIPPLPVRETVVHWKIHGSIKLNAAVARKTRRGGVILFLYVLSQCF